MKPSSRTRTNNRLDGTLVELIGLSPEKAEQIARSLDLLLAESHVHYMNVRGFHWNIRGAHFFELHVKFEELYTEALVRIDEIAERILSLGSTPSHTFAAYVEMAELEAAEHVSDPREAIQHVLDAFQRLIRLQRSILDLAQEAGDEGTADLMTQYIRELEKQAWMYRAFLD